MSIELTRLADDCLADIRPLFSQVFKHEIAPELLDWKYGGGRGQSWVARQGEDGVPLVHCGVFFRDILFHGRPLRVGQLVDLMASPKGFGLTRQNSPFALLLARILQQLPDERNPEGVTFGFPSGRSMRLAEHTGVARAVDHWFALTLNARHIPGAPRVRDWRAGDVADAGIADAAWQRMREDLRDMLVGVRDTGYLAQRYLRHPSLPYRLLVVESPWLRRPVGLAVIREGAPRSELLDLVGRWEDMPTLLRGVQHWMSEAGYESLVLYLTEGFARQLSPFADSLAGTEFRIMGNPFCPEPVIAASQGRWWLTGGDTDYR